MNKTISRNMDSDLEGQAPPCPRLVDRFRPYQSSNALGPPGADPSNLRLFGRFMIALVFCIGSYGAMAQDDGLSELEELEKLAAELGMEEELDLDFDLPVWDISGGLEIGVGYNNNVELAAFEREGSGFLSGTADAFAWRFPDNGFEWLNYLDASYTSYFSDEVEDASWLMGGSEIRWEPRDSMRYSAALRAIYQKEVIDASSLDASSLGTTLAEVSSLGFEPGVRWTFAPQWTAVLNLGVRYDDYRAPLDDLTEYEGGLAIERNTDRFGLFSVGYRHMSRDYQGREQAASGGWPLPDTQLSVNQDSLELRHELRGGERLEWRLKSRAGTMQNRDNGTGWYDYDRYFARMALSLDGGAWRLDVDAAWRDYKYLQQRAGFGDPPLRKRHEWSGALRFERDIREGLSAFAEAEFINSNSNDPFLDYDLLRGTIGIRWFR